MNSTTALRLALLGIMAGILTGPAAAQSPGAQAPGSAQAEAGEPRADTSAPAPDSVDHPAGPAASPSSSSSPSPSHAADPASAPPGAAAAAHETGAPRATASRPAADSKGAKPGGVDRLDLGVATVTGDREQPKVMYIVPWKKADIGDLSGKPMNSLLDEALAPVDRDEFKREVKYYNVVKADASQNGAPAKGEK